MITVRDALKIGKTMLGTVAGLQISTKFTSSAITIAKPIFNQMGYQPVSVVLDAFDGRMKAAEMVMTAYDIVSDVEKFWEIKAKFSKNPMDLPKHCFKTLTDGIKTETFVRKVAELSENPLAQRVCYNMPALTLCVNIATIAGSIFGLIGAVQAYRKSSANLIDWNDPETVQKKLEKKPERLEKGDKSLMNKLVWHNPEGHDVKPIIDTTKPTQMEASYVANLLRTSALQQNALIQYKQKNYAHKKAKAMLTIAVEVAKIAIVGLSTLAAAYLVAQTFAVPLAILGCTTLSIAALKYLATTKETEALFGMNAPVRPKFCRVV